MVDHYAAEPAIHAAATHYGFVHKQKIADVASSVTSGSITTNIVRSDIKIVKEQ